MMMMCVWCLSRALVPVFVLAALFIKLFIACVHIHTHTTSIRIDKSTMGGHTQSTRTYEIILIYRGVHTAQKCTPRSQSHIHTPNRRTSSAGNIKCNHRTTESSARPQTQSVGGVFFVYHRVCDIAITPKRIKTHVYGVLSANMLRIVFSANNVRNYPCVLMQMCAMIGIICARNHQ